MSLFGVQYGVQLQKESKKNKIISNTEKQYYDEEIKLGTFSKIFDEENQENQETLQKMMEKPLEIEFYQNIQQKKQENSQRPQIKKESEKKKLKFYQKYDDSDSDDKEEQNSQQVVTKEKQEFQDTFENKSNYNRKMQDEKNIYEKIYYFVLYMKNQDDVYYECQNNLHFDSGIFFNLVNKMLVGSQYLNLKIQQDQKLKVQGKQLVQQQDINEQIYNFDQDYSDSSDGYEDQLDKDILLKKIQKKNILPELHKQYIQKKDKLQDMINKFSYELEEIEDKITSEEQQIEKLTEQQNEIKTALKKFKTQYQENESEFTKEQIKFSEEKMKSQKDIYDPFQIFNFSKENQDQKQKMREEFNKYDFIGDLKIESTPEGFKKNFNLKYYQREALTWMKIREGQLQDSQLSQYMDRQFEAMHPLWKSYELKENKKYTLYQNSINGQLSLEFPISYQKTLGGILADEMGLGKTIMVLALILANPRPFQAQYAKQLNRFSSNFDINNLSFEQSSQYDSFDSGNLEFSQSDFEENDESQKLDKLFTKKTESQLFETEVDTESELEQEGENFKKQRKLKRLKSDKFDSDIKSIKKKNFGSKLKTKKDKVGGTLIILPATLMRQWKNEIKKHTKKDYITYTDFYGPKRYKNKIENYDVVFTTYTTLVKDCDLDIKKNNNSIKQRKKPKQKNNKKNDTPRPKNRLFNIHWHRIIIDEGHLIGNRLTQRSQAISLLKGQYKWILTGTPIQNRLESLYPLLNFIGHYPWNSYEWYNQQILKKQKGEPEHVFSLVQDILKPIMLRRTKVSKNRFGEPILQLPPKTYEYLEIELLSDDQDFYDFEFKKAKRQFEKLRKNRQIKVSNILPLLTKMRLCCDHQLLASKRYNPFKHWDQLKNEIIEFLNEDDQSKKIKYAKKAPCIELVEFDDEVNLQFIYERYNTPQDEDSSQLLVDISQEELLNNLEKNEYQNCELCSFDMSNISLTKCGHIFCTNCCDLLFDYGEDINLDNKCVCPMCWRILANDEVYEFQKNKQFVLDDQFKQMQSSKIQNVVDKTREILSENSNDKVLIFSYFRGTQEILKYKISQDLRINSKIAVLNGQLNKTEKEQNIKLFDEPEYKIFLSTLTAGNVGLNLTNANHCIIVSPWWNPTVELQAEERIYRVGQEKNVKIYKFYMKQTIELRIRELQLSKMTLIDEILHLENHNQDLYKQQRQKQSSLSIADFIKLFQGFGPNQQSQQQPQNNNQNNNDNDKIEFPGMQQFTQTIQNGLGDSIYVKCISSGEFMNSILTSLIDQSEKACQIINEDENFKGQTISVIGLSQGGLIARYITEKCDFGGKVARFVSAGGPHMGVATYPNCKKGVLCIGINNTINKYVYTDLVQNNIGPAQMWNNPKNQDAYLSGNQFLPYLNNQLEDQNASYKQKIEDLEVMMLAMFQGDTVVNPPSSAWFYFYDKKNQIVPLNEQEVYTSLGLKSLVQDDKLAFVSLPGNHLQMTQTDINKYFIPALKGQQIQNSFVEKTEDDESFIPFNIITSLQDVYQYGGNKL
ncbi:P-loop containing nucleoside triphosphate hydrolase [Pseudocohnilembus persalinus]|uniref:p-loop containing nucleoside triphosphate hydrolase n=1 Tax=Pseudocohnilembus persalinus TaxID=266149 RepID=A0A0V0R0H6_PSEPJ|nr:P-loop containing nucleoside triphosphate hydrolase [Pseudocohnilembus persalinus]|eukprot:KRX08014.1 P-loop containing nucleoside triphosphate hydrolase [Pseudocohnilembus persalinus]